MGFIRMSETGNDELLLLLVEDNAGDSRLISEMLAKQPDIHLMFSDSLSSAYELMANEQIDLVLLDLGLPESKGLDTLNAFRDRNPSTPVIVLTGLDDDEAAFESLRIGAQDFLEKGKFNSDVLVRSIRYAHERAQTQQKLIENEELFSAIMESTTDLIFTKDLEFRYTYVNRAMAELFRCEPDYLIGKAPEDLFDPPNAKMVNELNSMVLEGGITNKFRTMHIAGQDRVSHSVQVPLMNPNGEIRGICGIARDITEQRKSEDILRSERERAQRYLDLAAVMFIAIDTAGIVTLVNKKSCEVLGYTEEEIVGSNWFDNYLPSNQRETVRNVHEQLSSGEIEPIEYFENTILTNSGEERLIAWHNSILRDNDGIITGSLSSGEDITDRIKAEKEKQILELQIQHAQKLESLGVLAGGIAHDFNNILMAVLGNADLALQDLSTANPAYSNIKEIENAARRAADLARQMLAYSGKGKFLIEKISLNEAVEEMTNMLNVSISKKAVIKYHLTDNLPLIEADATQMRQIIMNLVTNASDAIDKTSGVISLSTGAVDCDAAYLASTYIDEELPEGQYVFVEVTDTGSGMSEETMQKLFDPFYSTKFTGRGLGLSAVLGIIRGHSGAIKVYSEPGKGSSIKILFPACCAYDEISISEDERSSKEWSGSGTILLVDDEESILSIGRKMIERLGFDVLTARDGREALNQFDANPEGIDLVILDLTMPHLDGEETFRELRRLRKDIRILMSSGYNEQEITQRFAGKSLAGFLQKPYIFNELKDKVREILE